MLKDYYSILEVSPSSSNREIKKKYRQLAKKWHPDVNKDIDTTTKMQELTEAYLILKDDEAKKRYDKEYYRYKNYKEKMYASNTKTGRSTREYNTTHQPKNEKSNYENYEIKDDILKRWIENAKNQAYDFARQAKVDAVGIGKRGAEYASKSFLVAIILFLILFTIIIFVIN